jgi:hypothetical protein
VRPALLGFAHDQNENDQVRLEAAVSLATSSDDDAGALLVVFATEAPVSSEPVLAIDPLLAVAVDPDEMMVTRTTAPSLLGSLAHARKW